MSTAPPPPHPDAAQWLHARRDELRAFLQRAAGTAVRASEQTHEVSDHKDQAGENAEATVRDTSEQQALQELADIEIALRRIREGSYGVCEDCGDPIAAARLLAVPAATLCARCQAARERWARRRA